VNASVPRAEAAAQRSIQLDPRNADGYVALGLVEAQRGKLVAAERPFSTALELDPNNPDGLHHYSISLAEVGRLKEALAMRERLRMLEPFVPVFNVTTGDLLWLNGQDNAAIMMLSDVPADFILRALFLARAYASVGRYADAADTLLPIAPGTFLPGTVEEAVRLLRTAPMPASSPQTLRHLGYLEFVYLHVGAHERVLDFYDGNVATGYSVPISVASLWHPSYESVRSSARFKTFVRNAGLLDYWRTKAWPDHCRPVGANDFVCD